MPSVVPRAGDPLASELTMNGYMVAYAKVTLDKHSVNLNGVYLGGVAMDQEEADKIAKSCVNDVKGGTVFPKVIQLEQPQSLIDTMYDAIDSFERMVAGMKETSKIIKRTQGK